MLERHRDKLNCGTDTRGVDRIARPEESAFALESGKSYVND